MRRRREVHSTADTQCAAQPITAHCSQHVVSRYMHVASRAAPDLHSRVCRPLAVCVVSFDVFEYMHRYGLPDESCANYMAEATPTCDQQAICSNCMPIGEEITPYKCWAVPSPILYYVHEYGQVHGEAAMMSEIFERGPITCGFASVDDFDYNYVSSAATQHSSIAHSLHCTAVPSLIWSTCRLPVLGLLSAAAFTLTQPTPRS